MNFLDRRFAGLLVIVVLWAAIYLPGLGGPEIKGEEGRRILPAVAMLETGNWIVPQIGGEPYLRKPPLVNWLIASSIWLCGVQNEFAARLPSVLSILILAVAMFWLGRIWMGSTAALLAALFILTNISFIEKGRLAEIEAVYIALSGIALVCWINGWRRRGNPWLTWIPPFCFLGLALLAKGPLHLLFFYGVVIPVLWREKRLRELWGLPHIAGLILMCALFALWAVPYFQATAALDAAGVWKEQMQERVGGGDFNFGAWLANIPRSLSNYLPWLILVPLLWTKPLLEKLAWFCTARNAIAICFLALMLIPGVLPRYTMPLLVPFSLLLAIRMDQGRDARWIRWWKTGNRLFALLLGLIAMAAPFLAGWKGMAPYVSAIILAGCCAILFRGQIAMAPVSLTLQTAVLTAFAMNIYAFAVIPRMHSADDTRPFAQKVNEQIPVGMTLHIFDPGFQPAMFYLRQPYVYVNKEENLPETGGYIFCKERALEKLEKMYASVDVLARVEDRSGKKFAVVKTAPVQGMHD